MKSSTLLARLILPTKLATRLVNRERDAVPEALNLIDDARPEQRQRAFDLLQQLEAAPQQKVAKRVGFTGPPGVGKSSLLDAVATRIREKQNSVGIVAVDPSSPRSGGALLGDRFRMRSRASDSGFLFRSMAARDRLGGLADATHASVIILSTVFDWVFVESVGVGQSESDIEAIVDSTVFIAQPGAGDTLQFMKAGVLEVPDIFVVNKADQGALAERTARELEAAIRLGEAKDSDWQAPVLLVSARDHHGIDSLLQQLEAHRNALEKSDTLNSRRQQHHISLTISALEREFGRFGLQQLGGKKAIIQLLEAQPEAAFFQRLKQLQERIKSKLS